MRPKAGKKFSLRFSFTLIELLITITIISLLAAMTAPALRDARNRAKDIKCVSNMRQIHLAIMLYVNDHNQNYPVLDPVTFNHSQFQYKQLELFSNTLSTPEIYRCPFRNASNDLSGGWGNHYGSGTFAGKPAWTEYKLGDDNYQLMTNNRAWGTQLRSNMVVTVTDVKDWEPKHRNGTGANFCFGDGRIQFMTPTEYLGKEPGIDPWNTWNWFRWGLYNDP